MSDDLDTVPMKCDGCEGYFAFRDMFFRWLEVEWSEVERGYLFCPGCDEE